jgi:hypothetical protein
MENLVAIPSLQDIVMLIIGFCLGTVFGWWARRFCYKKLRKIVRRM